MLTLTPLSLRSSITDCVKPVTPNLLALYAAPPAKKLVPAKLDIVIIYPSEDDAWKIQIEEVSEIDTEEITGQESLEYMLSLMAEHDNKLNEGELREYVKALKEHAGEDY